MQYSPSSKVTQKSTVRSDGVDVLSYNIINHASWGIYPTILHIVYGIYFATRNTVGPSGKLLLQYSSRFSSIILVLEYTMAQYRSAHFTYAQFYVLTTTSTVCQQS